MPQIPTTLEVTSCSDKDVTSTTSGKATSATAARKSKIPSCTICRRRKVRCDKQSPCSNCRSANITCVLPSTDRPPRWARRLEHLTNNSPASSAEGGHDPKSGPEGVLSRLQDLESIVRELRNQLKHANADKREASQGLSESEIHETYQEGSSTGPCTTSSLEKSAGRLVQQDASRSRYISSGFWSRINDELDGLKVDTRELAEDGPYESEDAKSFGNSPSIHESDRTSSERHTFLFRYSFNPGTNTLREYQPLPAQIPFLLDVFSRNVNLFIQIVHMPTIKKMLRDLNDNDMTTLTPANEALMFSIYYAAITSMEDEDIRINFAASKSDLSLKYRLGLEHALARAEFIYDPDLTVVQALAIFLLLVRRHDSPRFVWMMTGLVVRMAQYLGLHRDGEHFEHLTPFEIELQRRVWWAICILDLRPSEDQGTELTIACGSFDTKFASNINDLDFCRDSKQMPAEQDGLTDMSFARTHAEWCDKMRQMTMTSDKNAAPELLDQMHLPDVFYQIFERRCLQHRAESADIVFWVGSTIARIVTSKMTLILYLPVLFSSPSETFSNGLRIKLLISAIEIAEYNHILNSEKRCRQWRWNFQTRTHWHAIIYNMIEISRRPWSSLSERAWTALHSSWLIPTRSSSHESARTWFPLKKLVIADRRHRDAELVRLRADPQAAVALDVQAQETLMPASPGLCLAQSSVDFFHEQWRSLVGLSSAPNCIAQTFEILSTGSENSSLKSSKMPKSPTWSTGLDFNAGYVEQQTGNMNNKRNLDNDIDPTYNATWAEPHNRAAGSTAAPNFVHWLWADADPSSEVFSNLDMDNMDINMDINMDTSNETNWYDWIGSAQSMARDIRPGGNDII